MTATDRRAAALADLSREFVAAFGESLPYDSFATQRKEGEEWETGGRYYKRQGGKTVRVKNPKAGQASGSPVEAASAAVGEARGRRDSSGLQTMQALEDFLQSREQYKKARRNPLASAGDLDAARQKMEAARARVGASADQLEAGLNEVRDAGGALQDLRAAQAAARELAKPASPPASPPVGPPASPPVGDRPRWEAASAKLDSVAGELVAARNALRGDPKNPDLRKKVRTLTRQHSAAVDEADAADPTGEFAAARDRAKLKALRQWRREADARHALGKKAKDAATSPPPPDSASAPSATFPDEPGGPSKLPDLADVPTAGGRKAKAPAAPAGTSAAPTGPTERRTRGGVGVTMRPYQKPRPLAAGDLVPEGMAQAPPPTPAESARLDAHEKADSGRWGSRAARVIRRVTEAVRGLFTLGGLVTGAGVGAKVGGVVAGPLGVALGTAIGGGIGGVLGSWGGARSGRRAGVGLARATRPANRMAEVFAEPLPPDAVATIKARLKELAAAGGYQVPDVPDDVILQAIEMAARDEDAAGVGAAGAAMAGAADAFEEAAGGRRCRGKRLNKFRAAPFKMPYTPMPSYKPRGGVGMI